jgi:hypothetical protein
MDATDRDDGETGWVYRSRNPALIIGDDGEVAGIEDPADGDGVADACEGGFRPDPRSRRLLPHGGRQLSLYCGRVRHEGYLKAVRERGCEVAERPGRGDTSYPGSRFPTVEETLRPARIYYGQQVYRLQCCVYACPKGSYRPAYKGAQT